MKVSEMRVEIAYSGKKPDLTPLVSYYAEMFAELWAQHPELEDEYQEWKRERERMNKNG